MARKSKQRHELLTALRTSLRLSLGDVKRATSLAKDSVSRSEEAGTDPHESTLKTLYAYYGKELRSQIAQLQKLEADLIAAGAVNGGRSASAR